MNRDDQKSLAIVAGTVLALGGIIAFGLTRREAHKRRKREFTRLRKARSHQSRKVRVLAEQTREHTEFRRLAGDFHAADRCCQESRGVHRRATRDRRFLAGALRTVREKICVAWRCVTRSELGDPPSQQLLDTLAELVRHEAGLVERLERSDLQQARTRCRIDDLIDLREAIRERIRTTGRSGEDWYTRGLPFRPAGLSGARVALIQSGPAGLVVLKVARWMRVLASFTVQRILRAWRSAFREPRPISGPPGTSLASEQGQRHS